jgi:succinoglycan biosynthesis protein ExoA
VQTNSTRLPLVSVIVTGKNVEKYLEKCLESLLHQSYPLLEVTYVDAASSDRSKNIAEKFGAKVAVDVSANTPGRGRNLGLRVAKGEIIVFLDADCCAPSNWIDTLTTSLLSNKKYGGVGGSYLPLSPTTFESAIYFVFSTFLGSGGALYAMRFIDPKRFLREVESIPGGNAAYRRVVLEKVGGFNPHLRFCEDYDLNQRIKKLGYSVIYHPEASVYHLKNYTPKSFFENMFFYGWGRAKAVSTNFKLLKFVYIVPSLFLFSLLVLSILSIFNSSFLLLVGFEVAAYIVAILASVSNIVFSVDSFALKLKILTLAPFIYIVQHLAYGVGFFAAIVGEMVRKLMR